MLIQLIGREELGNGVADYWELTSVASDELDSAKLRVDAFGTTDRCHFHVSFLYNLRIKSLDAFFSNKAAIGAIVAKYNGFLGRGANRGMVDGINTKIVISNVELRMGP